MHASWSADCPVSSSLLPIAFGSTVQPAVGLLEGLKAFVHQIVDAELG